MHNSTKITILTSVFLMFFVIYGIFPPDGVDWYWCFSQVPYHLFDPYSIRMFINPPWLSVFLIPFKYFGSIGLVINAALTMLVVGMLVMSRGGSKLSLLLSLTSFPILSMIAKGNIEWVVMIGFILQNRWGLPLLLLKPQVGLLAFLSWADFKNHKILFFVPALVIVGASFLIWGNWVLGIMNNVSSLGITWNLSIFPYGIPVGVVFLLLAIYDEAPRSEIYGVIATLLFVPYFAAYSVGVLFILISLSYKKVAIFLWLAMWAGIVRML